MGPEPVTAPFSARLAGPRVGQEGGAGGTSGESLGLWGRVPLWFPPPGFWDERPQGSAVGGGWPGVVRGRPLPGARWRARPRTAGRAARDVRRRAWSGGGGWLAAQCLQERGQARVADLIAGLAQPGGESVPGQRLAVLAEFVPRGAGCRPDRGHVGAGDGDRPGLAGVPTGTVRPRVAGLGGTARVRALCEARLPTRAGRPSP